MKRHFRTALLLAVAATSALALPTDDRTAGRRDDGTGVTAANWLLP